MPIIAKFNRIVNSMNYSKKSPPAGTGEPCVHKLARSKNMNILTQFQKNQKVMSTREIAELCEKEHYHVKRDCETMFKGLQLDASKFGGIYFDALNRQQTEYLLDEELTMTLVTGYSIVLRNRVIKRWKELEQKIQKPAELSRMDLIQLALQAEQENLALRGQVAVLEPKAQALDAIADTTNTFCLRDAAKTIGVPERKFIQFLLDKRWIYRKNDRYNSLSAYSTTCDKKVMVNKMTRIIETDEGKKVYTQPRVTAFGLTRLAAMVEKAGLVRGKAA